MAINRFFANTANFSVLHAEKRSYYADADVSKFYADPYRRILSDALLREKKTNRNRN